MTERLLMHLQAHANSRGVILADEQTLLGKLRTTPDEFRSALKTLEEDGVIDVLSPLPFLVAKLKRKWSGMRQNAANSRPSAYSYSFKLSNNRLNNSNSYRPASTEALLREILETLGETDPKSFEGAIANFSPEVILKALDRVRRTRSLRKNRTALFRFLLTKLS